jgi:hypothetical protein
MKKFVGTVAVATLLSLSGWASLGPALARPPTATISPGYDARLAESRKALRDAESARQSNTVVTPRVSRPRHAKPASSSR